MKIAEPAGYGDKKRKRTGMLLCWHIRRARSALICALRTHLRLPRKCGLCLLVVVGMRKSVVEHL